MRVMLVSIILILLTASVAPAAERGDVWYSILFPGLGQIKTGRYGRGSLLLSAEMLSLTALVISNVEYDRAVEQYDRARALYLNADYIGDARYNYDVMQQKWDDADRLDTYRKVFLGTAVGVWVLGAVDMLWGGDPENMPVSLEYKGKSFMVTKTFSF